MSLYAANIAAGLGDPLGEHVEIVTTALIAAAAVILIIGVVSMIRRK